MTGNCQARFLEGLGLVTAPGYPVFKIAIMTIALRITNWIITFFFICSGLFTFYDLYFPKEAYGDATPQMSFLIVVSFPLSIAVLIISFFEIRKLLRHEWHIKSWQRKAYCIKAAISSAVALVVITFVSVVVINAFILSSC
ncbi:MAG: hypothetical protein ACYS0I_18445 [Planctomycetota bacterium]